MRTRRLLALAAAGLVAAGTAVAGPAEATHAWGSYHWARTSNPFTLKVGDNVNANWDAYLREASTDWSRSAVLDTTVVSGTAANLKRCTAPAGRVEVCNDRYGNNGWLGIAGISVSGGHITQGYVKLNDTYFNTTRYNTPAYRRFVMCQEIGHTLGLGHVNETFDTANTGSCMDYTSDPDGPPSNEHPDGHDYDMLASIYAHTDGTTTVGASTGQQAAAAGAANSQADWGRAVRHAGDGRPILFEQDLGHGRRIFTFVIWA